MRLALTSLRALLRRARRKAHAFFVWTRTRHGVLPIARKFPRFIGFGGDYFFQQPVTVPVPIANSRYRRAMNRR
jgi:hypothetical protein